MSRLPEPKRAARAARPFDPAQQTGSPERGPWIVLLVEEGGDEFMRLREGLTAEQAQALVDDPRPASALIREAMARLPWGGRAWP